MSALPHLVRRFFGSLRPGGPPATEVAWVTTQLLPAELMAWSAMPGPDRRHSAAVARRVEAALPDGAPRPVVAAALLHDIGKTAVGLRTPGRVGATALAYAVGPVRMARSKGRLGQYLRHSETGAELLTGLGSDAITIAWTREHHLHPDEWTVPSSYAWVLKLADDD